MKSILAILTAAGLAVALSRTVAGRASSDPSLDVVSAPAAPTLQSFHQRRVASFLAADGRGLSRIGGLPSVVGRRVHASGGVARVTREVFLGTGGKRAPGVYVLPPGHELPVRRVRPPTAAERRAVGRLHAGADVFVEDGVGYGAIRAKASCMDCHDSARPGDLLGAFAYGLAPEE